MASVLTDLQVRLMQHLLSRPEADYFLAEPGGQDDQEWSGLTQMGFAQCLGYRIQDGQNLYCLTDPGRSALQQVLDERKDEMEMLKHAQETAATTETWDRGAMSRDLLHLLGRLVGVGWAELETQDGQVTSYRLTDAGLLAYRKGQDHV